MLHNGSSNGSFYRGEAGGLTFEGSENNGLFSGRLGPQNNQNPSLVYAWDIPSILIDFTDEGEEVVTRIPVGGVRRLVASLGVQQVAAIAPEYKYSPTANRYASGFYDVSSRLATVSNDPLVAIILRQSGMSFDLMKEN